MLPARISSKKGFTLIEVIIVMAIIGILAGLFMGNVFGSLERGRDNKRKQDLRAIAGALELYYNDLGEYPYDIPPDGSSFTHPDDSSVIYLPKTPVDPSSGERYCYDTNPDDAQWYKITARLENDKDPDILNPFTNCAGDDYNYGLSSPNITL